MIVPFVNYQFKRHFWVANSPYRAVKLKDASNVLFTGIVMQSDRKSFCGDVVLNSVNMAFRDEDHIFGLSMKSKYSRILMIKI